MPRNKRPVGWYQSAKESGLCPRCHKNAPMPGLTRCAACKEYLDAYYQRNKQRILVRDKDKRVAVKVEVLEHYGGKCACCGENGLWFLTLDHIDGGGKKHRQQLGTPKAGVHFYAKIKELGYPEGLQVLCWNCNLAKAALGVCPHQTAK